MITKGIANKSKSWFSKCGKSEQEKILEKIAKIALFEKDAESGLKKIQKILQNNA